MNETENIDKNVQIENYESSKFVVRAVPTFIYTGTIIILVNYCIIPIIWSIFRIEDHGGFDLPSEFWFSWAVILMSWIIGKLFSKRA